MDIFDIFDPTVVTFVETLLRDGRVGVCAGNIRIFDYNKGLEKVLKNFKVLGL